MNVVCVKFFIFFRSKYRDDELQATEEDLRAIEEQDHVCTICKQPFPIRAMLLKHLTTCRAANEQSGTYLPIGFSYSEKIENRSTSYVQ